MFLFVLWKLRTRRTKFFSCFPLLWREKSCWLLSVVDNSITPKLQRRRGGCAASTQNARIVSITVELHRAGWSSSARVFGFDFLFVVCVFFSLVWWLCRCCGAANHYRIVALLVQARKLVVDCMYSRKVGVCWECWRPHCTSRAVRGVHFFPSSVTANFCWFCWSATILLGLSSLWFPLALSLRCGERFCLFALGSTSSFQSCSSLCGSWFWWSNYHHDFFILLPLPSCLWSSSLRPRCCLLLPSTRNKSEECDNSIFHRVTIQPS